ncbi:hypothetical protein M1N83_03605 [Dehalococcoidia bacterium]|nr:hypothetical protein [Dehalococcoidia bacterium]
MKQLPFQTRMEVLDFYLQGLSADKVSEKTGVSKGAVISILKEAREGKHPELGLKGRIDDNMAVRLRKQSLDLTQARLGFSFLQRLLAMGVEPDGLEEWIAFCSEVSPTLPEDFVPAAMELLKIKEETGLSYTDLSSQVRGLAEERQRLIEAIGDLKASEKRCNELKVKMGVMVGFVGTMLTSAMAMVTGQPMMAPGKPSTSTLLSIAIWPSGEIKPVLTADPPGQVGVIVVTFEEFEQTAVKLKNDVQSGELMPSVEDEIPGLIYKNLGKGHRES